MNIFFLVGLYSIDVVLTLWMYIIDIKYIYNTIRLKSVGRVDCSLIMWKMLTNKKTNWLHLLLNLIILLDCHLSFFKWVRIPLLVSKHTRYISLKCVNTTLAKSIYLFNDKIWRYDNVLLYTLEYPCKSQLHLLKVIKFLKIENRFEFSLMMWLYDWWPMTQMKNQWDFS